MSSTASDQSRVHRRLCQSCRDRKARFQIHGVVKADRDHTLCFECFRSERDSRRAQALKEALDGPLTRHQVEHRRRMLAHLEASRPQWSHAAHRS